MSMPPRQHESWLMWRIFVQQYTEYLCRTRISMADAMTTVGQRIAVEYQREYGVCPLIVYSSPRFRAIGPAARDEEIIKMVHVGSAAPYRRLEVMIEAMAELDDRFRLDFMLVLGNAGYLERLKKLASKDSRIGFVAPRRAQRNCGTHFCL